MKIKVEEMLENKKTVNTNMTETGNNSKAIVNINPKEKCNTVVNRALESVYGHCQKSPDRSGR